MSKTVYDATQDQIRIGYESRNEPIIEKETHFIFDKIITSLFSLCHDKIMAVKLDLKVLSLSAEYLLSDKHKKNLLKWLERLMHLEHPVSDLDFGKLKIDFENWYYELGGESFQFLYHETYLLTPQEAADLLGISKVTLNKYIKQGLECMDTSSHKKIPKYAIEIMKDPVYSILMQMVAQKKKRQNQTFKERLTEINEEISEFQLKYRKQTFTEQFGNLIGDDLDDPSDYYRWKHLEEEMQGILRLSGGDQ